MKPIFLSIAAACTISSTAYSQTAVKQYTIEQFYKTVSYGGGAFNKAENTILIHDNSSGIFNAYEMDLATKAKRQLTQSTKDRTS